MKKIIALCCFMCLVVGSLTACGDGSSAGELYVYNYGEYFDPDAPVSYTHLTLPTIGG